MRRFVFSIICLLTPVLLTARNNVGGIPSGYGGVMLQGFYWDSYSDTKWTNLESQADELASFFDLIWVPQSGYCGGGNQMGYMPLYYFWQDSSFGTESELRSMISTFKEKGLGTVADVVINHRNSSSGWFNVPTETYNGVTYSMSYGDFCRDDEGGEILNQGVDASLFGAYDTGDDFAGARDLDHTSENVQTIMKAYIDFLLSDIGYYGVRYDMAKGYAGYYTGMYNAAVNPQFSVGEYWDDTGSIENWINATGTYNGTIQSGAFDFPMKYEINTCCNAGSGWNTLGNGGGLIDNASYRRYAVTFVDNHDTEYYGSNSADNECYGNVLAANAFILAAPGTPCVYLRHWMNGSYKNEIKQMIHARKAAGMTNTGNWENGWWSSGSWSGIGTGTNGKVFVVMGNNTSSGSTITNNVNYDDYFLVSSGTNYAYYISKSCNTVWPGVPSGNYSGSVTLSAVTASSGAKIVYTLDGTDPTAASAVCSDGGTVTVNYNTLKAGLLVNGAVTGVATRYYGAMDGSGSSGSDTSSADGLTIAPGEQAVFFENTAGWSGTIDAYVWDTVDGKAHEFTSSWPGDAASNVGGNIWKYTYTGSETIPDDGSAGVIFDNGTYQTDDLVYHNGGYYNASGYQYTVPVSGGSASDGTWTVYFTDNMSPAWNPPYVWIWDAGNGDKNYTGGEWPGRAMSQQTDGKWIFTFTTTDNIATPMVIFSDGEEGGTVPDLQTADLELVNYGLYNRSGLIEVLEPEDDTTGITSVVTEVSPTGAVYNLQGVRVGDMSRKGIYIVDGKKYIRK